jgi:uncharacterized protein YndB with AHSA1/START domain
MNGETLRTVDGRNVLRVERRFRHPREKVWRALTRSDHLGQWFPSDVEMDDTVGGAVRFVFREGQAPPSEGVVEEFDPPSTLAYTWFDDLLRYELHDDGDHCLMVFTHTFDDRAGAASFASGWRLCFDGLEQVLDGRPVDVPADTGALHESYVGRLGLDEATSHDTADGWQVRYERQLTRPAEQVWARLGAAGTDAPIVGGRVPHGFTVAGVRAGGITAVDAPQLLEYEWLDGDGPGGTVRWQLEEGTGHGARLTLLHTGSADRTAVRSTALTVWRDHIERLAGALLSAVAPPPSGPSGTLTTTDGRYALRFERTLDHPPEKVWRALTEREQLIAWFPAEVDLDVPAGTEVRFAFPSGRAPQAGGTVTRADAPELLEYLWGDALLRWELAAIGDGACRLVFTHVFDDRTGAVAAASGWHAGFEVLAARLDGRPLDWSVWDRAAELEPGYAADFRTAVKT